MVVDDTLGTGPLERRANEERALDGGGDGNRFSGYREILSGRLRWS
jgi:hypothetical protein